MNKRTDFSGQTMCDCLTNLPSMEKYSNKLREQTKMVREKFYAYQHLVIMLELSSKYSIHESAVRHLYDDQAGKLFQKVAYSRESFFNKHLLEQALTHQFTILKAVFS